MLSQLSELIPLEEGAKNPGEIVTIFRHNRGENVRNSSYSNYMPALDLRLQTHTQKSGEVYCL